MVRLPVVAPDSRSELRMELAFLTGEVESLLRDATMQQLSQPRATAANASAEAAAPPVLRPSAPGASASGAASSQPAGAAAASQAPPGLPGPLPPPPPPPRRQPYRAVTSEDIYFYDEEDHLRCKVCYRNNAPCHATDEHIATRKHQQRAQTPWLYNYGEF